MVPLHLCGSRSGPAHDVARHFLTHTDYPPANTAFFFVLEAVGDTETALVLIRALADPPKVESGPVIKVGDRSWLLERDGSEIRVAIESVLVNEPVRGDPRVVDALMEAIERLKAKRGGAASAGTVVALLGRCAGPEARAALQRLAADADASIRSLALQGLGESARAGKAAPPDRATTLATLAQGLSTDPDSRARLEAAGALGRLGSAEAVPSLREALVSERDPQVVDAIVLALYSLIEQAAVRRRAPGLVRAPQLVAPPPPLPPGARAITIVPVPPLGPREPSPVKFDEATRDRLLTSAVEVLSKHSAAFPGKGKEVSYTTAQLVRDALWEISGRDMGVALVHADRIAMTGARYFSGRYSASYDLWNRDRPAYLDYRRPRQAVAAALAALLFVPLFIWRRFRRADALVVIAVLGWGAWSLTATDVRELPPSSAAVSYRASLRSAAPSSPH
ncbi:MAG: HEAT repeat domain-containing protein [Betaproteobacteria bacterium]|nr:HEAT repeat domain-containing protein [Betaproteobacteria bacterium]